MSCPRSLFPGGMHSWLQYRNGRMPGNWKCLQCGKRRRRQRRPAIRQATAKALMKSTGYDECDRDVAFTIELGREVVLALHMERVMPRYYIGRRGDEAYPYPPDSLEYLVLVAEREATGKSQRIRLRARTALAGGRRGVLIPGPFPFRRSM